MTQQEAGNSSDGRPAAVYRLWAADGALLYIGSAYDPEERCKAHHGAPWWPNVASRSDEPRVSRQDAYLAEMAAIAAEKPRHNVNGSARYSDECRSRAREEPHRARIRAGSAAANGAPRQVVDAILRGELKSWGPRTGPVPFESD